MLWRVALAAAELALAHPAAAQDYPNRLIRFIVPFGAGGPIVVRYFDQRR